MTRSRGPHRSTGAALVALIVAVCSLTARDAGAGSQVTVSKAALATDSPLATKAGLAVLQRGGSAADAAVAVAFALAVLHPQSGNLGGGGFLVYYDAQSRGVWTLDFREVSPRAATRDMFNEAAKKSGALTAAVPGTVAGVAAMHEKFGTLPWKELLAPAIALAHENVANDATLTKAIDDAKRDRNLELKNVRPAELAATLERLAERGAHDFYDGEIAKKLVDDVRRAGGILGDRDLREYQPVWRAPIKLRYGAFEIYAAPPPSSGSIVIGESLNILGGDDLRASGFQTRDSLHLLIEAERRASIDSNRYVGDPTAARIPYRDLLSAQRAEQWRRTIDPKRVIGTSALSEPRGVAAEGTQTTHFTIVDTHGNIASLTTSLGNEFGSGYLVPSLGFFMNEAMTDFTQGANVLEPLRRPASSMSPVIVLRDGKPFLAIGTPGGPAIPTTILQVFLNLAAYGRTLKESVAAPRYHQQAVPEDCFYERDRAPKEMIDALNAMGHGVAPREALGDVQAILFENGRLVAVSDPRGNGAAGGF